MNQKDHEQLPGKEAIPDQGRSKRDTLPAEHPDTYAQDVFERHHSQTKFRSSVMQAREAEGIRDHNDLNYDHRRQEMETRPVPVVDPTVSSEFAEEGDARDHASPEDLIRQSSLDWRDGNLEDSWKQEDTDVDNPFDDLEVVLSMYLDDNASGRSGMHEAVKDPNAQTTPGAKILKTKSSKDHRTVAESDEETWAEAPTDKSAPAAAVLRSRGTTNSRREAKPSGIFKKVSSKKK